MNKFKYSVLFVIAFSFTFFSCQETEMNVGDLSKIYNRLLKIEHLDNNETIYFEQIEYYFNDTLISKIIGMPDSNNIELDTIHIIYNYDTIYYRLESLIEKMHSDTIQTSFVTHTDSSLSIANVVSQNDPDGERTTYIFDFNNKCKVIKRYTDEHGPLQVKYIEKYLWSNENIDTIFTFKLTNNQADTTLIQTEVFTYTDIDGNTYPNPYELLLNDELSFLRTKNSPVSYSVIADSLVNEKEYEFTYVNEDGYPIIIAEKQKGLYTGKEIHYLYETLQGN
jgi:hypothetical protein